MKEYVLIDKDDNCYFVESDSLENVKIECCINNNLVISDIVDYQYMQRKVRWINMYYVTTTARRKNGKRHIAEKTNDLNKAIETMERINKKYYIVELYNGRWKRLKMENINLDEIIKYIENEYECKISQVDIGNIVKDEEFTNIDIFISTTKGVILQVDYQYDTNNPESYCYNIDYFSNTI